MKTWKHISEDNRKPIDYADQTESKCPFVKFIYDLKVAQRKADANLVNSRKGIDIDSNEFNKLDAILKKGTDENKDTIDKSITTLYSYINNGYLETKMIDLPCLLSIKKET